MTREPVTCGCGAVLKDSYPSAITAHGETKRHREWMAAKYDEIVGPDGGWAPSSADDTPIEPNGQLREIPAQRNDETAGEYLRRLEFDLGSSYDVFVSTDEGQKILAQAAEDDKEARKAAAKAEVREKILAAKEQRATTVPQGSGPVQIIQFPTNGKPTAAARKAAGVKEPKPKATKVTEPKVAKGVNPPLKLGDPVTIGGITYRAILHRDGSVAKHQTDNYIWKCPVDGKRLRAAECPDHKGQKAPAGYRVEDRIVR